ncbi:MAG: quinone oxidoreductase family protein, partial [Alphaproteobacteria bacterium]
VADWGRTIPVPANNMTWVQASTLPVALQTMHNAAVTAGRFKAGETILIQGASTGVGLMGLQIAKALGAKLVVGSSTNPDRRARLKEFGADLTIDSTDEGWVDQVLEATGGDGVDLIVDQISGYVANANLAATKILGRIVNVGRLGGFTGEFNFDLHAMRRIDYIGVTFRTRSVEEVRDVVQAMKNDLWDAVEAGELSLPIDSEYALDDAAEAVEYMKANKHFGKIVLNVD